MFVTTITFLMFSKTATSQYSELLFFVVESMMGGDLIVTNIKAKFH